MIVSNSSVSRLTSHIGHDFISLKIQKLERVGNGFKDFENNLEDQNTICDEERHTQQTDLIAHETR